MMVSNAYLEGLEKIHKIHSREQAVDWSLMLVVAIVSICGIFTISFKFN